MKNTTALFFACFLTISIPLAAQKVGIGTTTPQNTLDVAGGLSVGTGYSGTYTAPANGAIFEGGVGIGVTTLNAAFLPKLEVNGDIMGTVFRDRNNGNFGLAPSSTLTSLYAAGSLYGANLIDYNNTDYFLDPSGTDISLNVAGKIHATSIIDEDNTSYFLDPSSFATSLNAAGSIYARMLIDQDNTNFYVDPSSIFTSLYASGDLYGKTFYDFNNASYYLDPGNANVSMNVAGKINANSIELIAGIVANKFWDSNNTSYYLDPSSTTTSLDVAGDLRTDDDIHVADDAFIGDDLDVNGSADFGSTSGDEKIKLIHGPSGGFQIQNSGNNSFWDIWNKPDGDLGLYLNASLRGQFNFSSGIYTSASDRRLKDNIRSLGSVLPSLLQLQAKKYSFKADPDRADNIGFIAQEVEKLFPELVSVPSESGKHEEYYMMDYAGFGVLAVQAIQEQQAIIESQNERLEAQGREINELKSELAAIKALVGQVVKNQ